MQNNIKNSSGKIIGTVVVNDTVTINNHNKPTVIIDNQDDVRRIKSKDLSEQFLLHLYDDYFLTIGEIAALYEVCYSNINRLISKLTPKTCKAGGRRNRAYGKHVSKEQSSKMSASLKGRKNTYYERTPEIRQQISEGLKRYYSENPQNPTPHRENWKNGVYKDIDFHHGIGGSFYSEKNKCRYNFRSLLELSYMLSLESDTSISSYEFEPFHITCEDDSVYTPDILINNIRVVELKSKKYLDSLPEENYERFLYKVEQGKKYCTQHGLTYEVVYDIDIGFDGRRMKSHLRNNPDIVEKNQIIFHQPERMVNK